MGKHDKYLKSRWSYAIAMAVSLLAAYGFVSLGLDSGSYWHYLGALVCLVFSIKCMRHTVRKPSQH